MKVSARTLAENDFPSLYVFPAKGLQLIRYRSIRDNFKSFHLPLGDLDRPKDMALRIQETHL